MPPAAVVRVAWGRRAIPPSTPIAAAIAATANAGPISARRDGRCGIRSCCGVGRALVDAMRFSTASTSAADCQRSFGDLRRHTRTTQSISEMVGSLPAGRRVAAGGEDSAIESAAVAVECPPARRHFV